MFTWICPQCGREVPPAYADCPDCAAKAAAAGAAAPPQPPAEPGPPLQSAPPPAYPPPPPPAAAQPYYPPPAPPPAPGLFPPAPPAFPAGTITAAAARRSPQPLRPANLAVDGGFRPCFCGAGVRHLLDRSGGARDRAAEQAVGQRGEPGGEVRRQSQPVAEVHRGGGTAIRSGCQEEDDRSEERRVGKECRSRW